MAASYSNGNTAFWSAEVLLPSAGRSGTAKVCVVKLALPFCLLVHVMAHGILRDIVPHADQLVGHFNPLVLEDSAGCVHAKVESSVEAQRLEILKLTQLMVAESCCYAHAGGDQATATPHDGRLYIYTPARSLACYAPAVLHFWVASMGTPSLSNTMFSSMHSIA